MNNMKKLIIGIFALALLGASTMAMAGVGGTYHDVRFIAFNNDLEPCAWCHTPHKGTGDYPLWNRAAGAAVYTMYDSPSFDMNEGAVAPAGISAMCLTCHNGVASTLVNYPGTDPFGNPDYDFDMTGRLGDLTTDMRDDHPISFTYDPSKDDDFDANGFPAVVPDLRGRNFIPALGGNKLPLYGVASDQLECATCHAVHHTGNYDPVATDQVYFLRMSNQGSDLCVSCHVNRL